MAKNSYTPESEYLKMAYQSFYDYFYLTFKPYISFKKGQEEEFMKMMAEFKKYHEEHGGQADIRAKDELKGIMDSSELNWNEIWDKADIEDYCGPLEAYIEKLLRFVDWEIFKEKVDKSDNYILVRRLYSLYCWQHGIKNATENKVYNAYIDKTLERTGKTPEGELRRMIDDFTEIFERGHGVDTIKTYLQSCEIEIFAMLMEKANLDTLVQYNNEKVSLKNLLLYRILKWGNVSDWLRDPDEIPQKEDAHIEVDNENELKVLFKNCDDFIFNGKPLDNRFNDYDRVTLTYMMGDIEESLEIFDKEEYPVYNQDQLNSLLESGIYQTNNSPFVDRFATMVRLICIDNSKTVMENGINRLDFMNFIYSSKVRVISYATLMILKIYLSEKEFNDYLTHINDEGIQIYFGDYLGFRGSNDANPLFNNPPVIMTLGYATDSDLNFIDQTKLNAIIEELGKHKSGIQYLKSNLS